MFNALATLIVYGWMGLDPATRGGAALHFFVMDTVQICKRSINPVLKRA